MRARFGPAGNERAFPYKSSVQAPGWLSAQGLDWYEYQCGKGIHIGVETGREIGAAAAQAGIGLSIHAPYYINLANPQPERVEKTVEYIRSSCALAAVMGAQRVVIHTGALMGRPRREALDIAKATLARTLAVCGDAGLGQIHLCPETMGKVNQLGDLEEVLELCTLDERLIPCVDFGHLYARSLGQADGQEVFAGMLDRMAQVLGEPRARQFHSHFSHIEFTVPGGEKCHRTFEESGGYGPDWQPLAREVARRGWQPVFICESAGTQARDARIMKDIYLGMLEEKKDGTSQ